MNNKYTIPISDNCLTFQHSATNFCLPQKVDCDKNVIDGLLVECGKQWNCNLPCDGDRAFTVPIPSDGKLMIQLNFNDGISADRTNPTAGWGTLITAKLFDQNDNEVTANYQDFSSRVIAGYSGDYNYQIIEIDATLINAECFYIEFESQGETVCTQYFQKEDCIMLVSMKSDHTKYDCFNNYYGSPIGAFVGDEFKYDNTIWMRGMYKYYGTKSTNDGEVNEYGRMYSNEVVPPFFLKYMTKKIASIEANNIYIGEEKFDNTTGNTFTPRPKSSMFELIIELERQECDSGGCL